jgi:tRNA-uridine 2-sulfurtransferase
MMNMNNRVLVGMSGGVDSSVAAFLLSDKGYDVTGVTIAPFNLGDKYSKYYNDKGCNKKSNIEDAKKVCDLLGIVHRVVDYSEVFHQNVADYFLNEYLAGRTPNPCVQCNPIIKWGKLMETAKELDCYYIATGHYAKIICENDDYYLQKANDSSKDQTYFLWKLSNQQLSKTLFPLGDLNKTDTRRIAKENGLTVFDKAESQEVCFIPDNDYRSFLELMVGDNNKLPGKGNVIFMNKVIGEHSGYPFYTIGQRKGLGVTYKEPLYVKKIITESNEVIVGRHGELYNNGLIAGKVNLRVEESFLSKPRLLFVKVRYKDPGCMALCSLTESGKLKVVFPDQIRAITPGQSVVIYDEEKLIAGGVIEEWF